MKINNPINSYIETSYQSFKSANHHYSNSRDSINTQIDISISDTSQSIFQSREVNNSLDEERLEKLIEVKEAIKEGRYKVSAEQLSESIYKEIQNQKDIENEE